MRLDLDSVSAVGTFELPDGRGGTNQVRVETLERARGVIEVAGYSTTLEAITADHGVVGALRWLAGPCLVTSERRIDIDALTVSGAFGRGPENQHPERPVVRVLAGALEAEAVTLSMGALTVTGRLSVRGLEVSLTGGELTVRVESLSLAGVRVDDGGVTVTGGELQAAGLAYSADGLAIDSLALDEAAIEVADLLAIGDRRPPPRPPELDQEAKAREVAVELRDEAAGPVMDFRFLDFLNGQIDVDLTVDITVPVIGRRHATHHFRVPVQAGALNYKELERDLSALEDSVIDFHLKDDRLALEKGIPLIPILFHKPILYWPLAGDDLALAKRQLVRLRTLMDWRIPDERKEDDQPPAVSLRRLELHNTDIELALGGPTGIDRGDDGRILLGSENDPALARLGVRGEIVFKPDEATDPTLVKGSITNLNAGLHALRAGEVRIDARTIHADGITDVAVEFAGLRPGHLTAGVRGMRCEDLRVELPKPAE